MSEHTIFLHPDNKDFVENKLNTLVHEVEILSYLRKKLKIVSTMQYLFYFLGIIPLCLLLLFSFGGGAVALYVSFLLILDFIESLNILSHLNC
jgi:hypothetical protein